MNDINRQIIEQDLTRKRQQDLIAEADKELNGNTISFKFKSNLHKPGANLYKLAYDTLNQMLQKKIPLNYKKAVFLSESPFYEGRLRYAEFDQAIKNSTNLIKLKLKQDKLPDTDLAKNWEIFQFFSDTIKVKGVGPEKKTITHYPMRYDFEDFYGEKDWTKGMVSKLLRYQTGQCHSMPLLYLILTEELGSTAYLAYAPEHSYIKIPLSNGRFQNLELTNGRLTTDSYILGSGFIKSEALANKVYMNPLSKKETVASCMLDLAKGYRNKYGFDEFYLTMVNTALNYVPNDVVGIYQRGGYYYWLLQSVLEQDPNILKKLRDHPELQDIVDNLKFNNERLMSLGYSEMPKEAYADWLKSMDKEREKSKKLVNALQENLWSTKK